MRLRLLSCVLLLSAPLFSSGALAQQPSASGDKPATGGQPAGQTTTLSLTANLVNLPVIVRDKKGALMQNLTKADFTLSVDGHAQTIRYFDRDQNLPLTLGLLVDTSESQRSVLDEERSASSSFIDGMLTAPAGSSSEARPADRAFIIQFARQVELLQDLTSSRPKLQAAIKDIGTANPNSNTSNDDDSGSSGGHSHGGGTTLYDGVFLSADELMKKQQGRKALIILTDGVDRNSKETLNSAIEAAQRADTIIYAIYFKGQEQHHDQDNRGSGNPGGGGRFPGGGGYPGGGGGYPGGGGGYPGGGRNGGGNRGGGGPTENRVDGKKILQKMADETGGRMFEVKGKDKVVDIYAQIAEELRSQYRLGYTPDATITGDGYHQIDLRVPAHKDFHIQTRDGYYTGK
jgi:VWFA-related protein